MNPQETAQAVLDQIRFHPETHDQSDWGRKMECGTFACVAGWTVILNGVDEWQHSPFTANYAYMPTRMRSGLGVAEMARLLLGLRPEEADYLFSGLRTRKQVVAVLEYVAKGDPIDWVKLGIPMEACS